MKIDRMALSAAVLLGAGVVALAGWYLWKAAPPQPDPACTADPKLRLVIGGQYFEVPRTYLPNIYVASAKGDDLLARPICQRPSDSPIIANMLSIHPGEQPYFVDDEFTRPLKAFQIEIHERQPSYQTARAAYKEALDFIVRQGFRLEDLPEKNGFRAYDSLAEGRHIYVALSNASDSRDDVPLVIECSAPGVRSVSIWSSGRICRTSGYQTLFEGVVMRFDFYDGAHPVSTWLERDRQIRALIASIHVDNES